MVFAKGGRRATYDDILKLPDHVVGEIVDGELFVSPRPAVRHANTATVVCADVVSRFQGPPGPGGPGGWWILVEPELHFGEDVLVPDLAGWRRERMTRLPDTHAIELAADWVCEILSPSTERLDRTRKLGVYARVGVPWAWLINPTYRTIEVLSLEQGKWTIAATVSGVDRVRLAPFDAVELDITRWWLED
jgi:Uma2 family endonuclease